MTRLAEIRVADDLISRARCGDERAQAHLYVLLAPGTLALIRRLIGAGAASEDLFQDTMMTVYERLDTYRGEAPLGAWVRRIAISRSLMFLRSPWQRARLSLGFGQEEGGVPEALPLAVPSLLAESLDMERALASLSPTARAVVWLYDVEGYSHEEIGRAFGRTVSFSKSQLARAHLRLRQLFEPQGESQPCAPT